MQPQDIFIHIALLLEFVLFQINLVGVDERGPKDKSSYNKFSFTASANLKWKCTLHSPVPKSLPSLTPTHTPAHTHIHQPTHIQTRSHPAPNTHKTTYHVQMLHSCLHCIKYRDNRQKLAIILVRPKCALFPVSSNDCHSDTQL